MCTSEIVNKNLFDKKIKASQKLGIGRKWFGVGHKQVYEIDHWLGKTDLENKKVFHKRHFCLVWFKRFDRRTNIPSHDIQKKPLTLTSLRTCSNKLMVNTKAFGIESSATSSSS